MFRRAVNPGEILSEELAEFGVTPTELARQIDVAADWVSRGIAGGGRRFGFAVRGLRWRCEEA